MEDQNKQTDTSGHQPAVPPQSDGSIKWVQQVDKIIYCYASKVGLIRYESDVWVLRFRGKELFSHRDIQVVQEWADKNLSSNRPISKSHEI